MFTGIIESVAEVKASTNNKDILSLKIKTPTNWKLKNGQSIATDGVCLTVTEFDENDFTLELMPETTKRTTFGRAIPKKVNLERAMSPQGLLEGHIVQGHVDGLSKIIKVEETPQWRTLRIAYPEDKAGLLVEKGSITIDGISLTIVEVDKDWFSVSLIPHTISHTTLGDKTVDDEVNIEYDILSKLIERQLKLRI